MSLLLIVFSVGCARTNDLDSMAAYIDFLQRAVADRSAKNDRKILSGLVNRKSAMPRSGSLLASSTHPSAWHSACCAAQAAAERLIGSIEIAICGCRVCISLYSQYNISALYR